MIKRLGFFYIFFLSQIAIFGQYNLLDEASYLLPNIGQYSQGNKHIVAESFVWRKADNEAYIHSKGITFYNPQALDKDSIRRYEAVNMVLVGAQTAKNQVQKEGEYFEIYYNHASKPGLKLQSVKKVIYPQIYNHIDWEIEERGNHLKHSFRLKPGADVQHIKILWKGLKKIKQDEEGRGLVYESELSLISETHPVFIQNGKKYPSKFKINGFEVSFELPDEINTNEEYFIDPQIYWSTYYSGNNITQGTGTAVDSDFNVYLAGNTNSTINISTPGAHQTATGGLQDLFLVKFDECGRRLWATYYGGSLNEQGAKVATDNNNNVYLLGRTNSNNNISTPGSFQANNAGLFDMFIVKFANDGARQWGTYYGGTVNEIDGNITTDNQNNVIVLFSTNSSGLATAGAHETTTNFNNALLAKFNTNGNRLWATYYGGMTTTNTRGIGVCTDPSNDIYFTGITASASDIATAGTHQTTFPPAFGNSGYLAKLSANGVRQWGTYIGGNGNNDQMNGVAASATRVFVVGAVTSTNMATPGTWQTTKTFPGFLGYIGAFNTNGTRVWATYYGGSVFGQLDDIALDGGGNPLVGGRTSATGLATPNSIFTSPQGQSAIIARFSAAGAITWGSYLINNNSVFVNSIAFGGAGTNSLYVAGSTFGGAVNLNLGVFGFQNQPTSPQTSFLTKMPVGNVFSAIRAIQSADTCTGGSISVNYIVGGMGAGNQLNLELSDANGNFTTPTVIGSINTTNGSGVINGTFPINLPTGTGYRIRLVNTNPNNISQIWCDSLTILSRDVDSITVNGPMGICPNDSVELVVGVYAGAIYQWFLNGIAIPGSNSEIIYAKDTGDYYVEISVPNTCGIISDTISIGQFTPPTVTLNSFPPFCTNQNPYTFTEGNPPGGDYIGVGVMNNIFVPSGLSPGLYPITYIYTDSNGCRDSATLNLLVSEGPSDTIELGLCSDEPLILPDGQVITAPGEYSFIEIASNGCDSIVTVIVTQGPPIAPFLPEGTNLCRNETFYVEVPGFESYLWSTGRTEFNEVLSKAGIYTLTVTDTNGCSRTDSIVITSVCEPILYIPNAFSPNADRRNDVFKMYSTQELVFFDMQIFNRWGQLIFQTDDINFEWDGTYNGQVVAQDIYVYRIIYRYPTIDGRIIQKQERGNIHIIR